MAGDIKQGATGALKRIFQSFTGAKDGAEEAPNADSFRTAYASVSQITALLEERARLVGLREDEIRGVEGLNERLTDVESRRISALTEHRISAESGAVDTATKLLAEATAIKQQIGDAQAVADGIDRHIKELDIQMEPLKRRYRLELGVFLNGLYSDLAKRYAETAPQLLEIVLMIAALHRVMMRYQAGSTNGWDGGLLLPRIEPGNGKTLEPIADAGAGKFAGAANARMEDIIDQMRASGFVWRFDP